MVQAVIKRSAGLDIHKKLIVATVQIEDEQGEVHESTREFGTLKADYHALAGWLLEHRVQSTIMESTSIYWKRPFAELEAKGLHVLVVNARHVKQVPGRKTDVKDSQWLATLARFGLVNGSFIPEKAFRELRLITRYHTKLKGMLASEKNRLHKALDDAGIRLGNVLTDINGKSAKTIINGLIVGEPVEQLLSYAQGKLKRKLSELNEVLDDSLSSRYRFLLKQIQAHIDHINTELAELEAYVNDEMEPYRRQWEILQTMPGIDAMTAAKLLVEIGVDMKPFKSSQKLASWSGMCPGNNESAGKRYSGRTRKGNAHVRRLLCESANAAARTRSQFKSHYQGLLIRRGHKKAIMAVGHKLLRVAYCLLKNGQSYQDPEVNHEALMVQRNAPRWIKMLEKFGYFEESGLSAR